MGRNEGEERSALGGGGQAWEMGRRCRWAEGTCLLVWWGEGPGLWGWLETMVAVSGRIVGYSCKSLYPLKELPWTGAWAS